MPPTNTYKIQLEQIQSAQTDSVTKELATEIVRLSHMMANLARVIGTIAPTGPVKAGAEGAEMVLRRIEVFGNAAVKLSDSIGKLESKLGTLPEAIHRAVSHGKEIESKVKEISVATPPEMVEAAKMLVSAAKDIKASATYQTGREAILEKVEKAINELMKRDRSAEDIGRLLKELTNAIGLGPGKASPKVSPEKDVQLFGKALRDMGDEFENIKKELKDRIVVAVDLETSSIVGKKAREFGQNAAEEFLTQIAYKKGTLSEIRSGTAKEERMFIKPNVSKAQYEKAMGGFSGAFSYDMLQKEGKDINEALQKVAADIKDAQVVMGHNIAKFDIPVLENQFKKAGIQFTDSIDEFVDTVNISRKKFPHRVELEGPGRQPKAHSLERYEKDFKQAGIEIKSVGSGLHDASYDLEILGKLLNAFEDGTKEFLAAQHDISATLKRFYNGVNAAANDAKEMQKQMAKFPNLADTADNLDKHLDDASDNVSKLSKSAGKMSINIEKLSDIRSGLQAAVYKERVIMPNQAGGPAGITGVGGVTGSAQMADFVGDLSRSLAKLQSNIVTALEKGLSKGMEIIRDESGEAFKLAEGGREFELNIADVRKLRTSLGEMGVYPEAGASAAQLVDSFKSAFASRKMRTIRSPEDMAAEVEKVLTVMPKEVADKMGKIVSDLAGRVKQKTASAADIANMPELESLYKNVAVASEAQKELSQEFIKRMAIPAARMTPQGTLAFETKYGAERALSGFATITTGLEKLVDEAKSLGAPAMEIEGLTTQVAKIPFRTRVGTPEEAKAEELAAKLINRVVELGGRTQVGRGYQRAIALKGIETGTMTKEQATEFMQTADQGFEDLINKSKELKISALDVAKALDEVNFENFYDVLDRLFQAGKTPLLERQARNIGKFPGSPADIREISAVINELLGLTPLREAGRPKRQEYDEQAIRVLTKAVEKEKPTEKMRPAEEKQHIIDVALSWKEMANNAQRLGENLYANRPYMGVPVATPLDLSDAASSQLRQFNKELHGNLKELDKTMVAMSTADIRGLAPFQQFSSIQRQMSYAMSAIEGGLPGGGRFETPALMSAKERALIESGKYGTGGYGLNVLTELRNSANTFEDQVVISGKLAEAFTQITGRIVKPAASLAEGRVITAIRPGEKEGEAGIHGISDRGAKLRADQTQQEFYKVLKSVVDEFQQILGVPQRYRGRADIAEIGKEVENVVREHRGATIEVQTAKLTETFLNYFGRKISTRFGSKGVAITPGTPPTEIREYQDIAKAMAAGLKAKVEPGAGLGYAKVPKSMGELVSDLLVGTEEEMATLDEQTKGEGIKLRQMLVESGNKFILEMFRDASKGLVTEQEATKQSKLFADVRKAWQQKFGTELAGGASGIKEIKGAYQEKMGFKDEEGLYTLKPIEARISSRGIAKRGLVPEILEGMVNNLIGTKGGATTLVDTISKEALTETDTARQNLNEALKELGYAPFKDINEIVKRLKLEKPDLDPEVIKKLTEWERQWSVYTEVVDEFGKKMQSFVSPKFLQIIEEPHRFEDWSPEEIEKGAKGAKLDFQSFAAMAGVFGEGSEMLKELASQTATTSKEGWELLRAFQMLDPKMKEFGDTLTKDLPVVNLKDVRGFEKATGTLENFKGTLFDIGKFPTAFKLKMPSTKPGTKDFYEEMYIPGPALRATYPEELMGEAAPTNVARYMANMVNAAKEVEELTEAASKGGTGLGEDFQKKFAPNLRAELTTTLTDLIKEFRNIESSGVLTADNVSRMESTISKYMGGLSTTRKAPPIYQKGVTGTERESVEAFAASVKGTNKYSQTLGRISDILIGANPESLKDEMNEYTAALKKWNESKELSPNYQAKLNKYPAYGGDPTKMFESFMKVTQAKAQARAAFDVELEAGNLDQFSKGVGLSLQKSVQEALEGRLESLGRAKVAYFKAIGEEVIGRKKGIEDVFFQRITPAVTGKAVNAITDKTEELRKLLEVLNSGKNAFGIPDLSAMTDTLEKITKQHVEYIAKAKQLGLPVLKEGEIGLPTGAAQKIKVKTGAKGDVETDLAELIKKQQDVFVESIRYPFTGTLSVQPHKARLMAGELSQQSIAVPGAPKIDLAELNKIVGTLREHVGLVPRKDRVFTDKIRPSLMEQREAEWAKGTEESAAKARELTTSIESLIKVINEVTPKYTEHEQKLDFDGDTLFVHTGQLEKSRKEIQDHYESLKSDATSVRNLFRTMFTAVKESEASSLAEMSYVFGKKHPEEKGFKFLTKPYIEEEMKNLDFGKVMEGLFTYSKKGTELTNLKKAGSDEWKAALDEWSRTELSEAFKTSFERTGATQEQRLAMQGKMAASPLGMPDISTAASDLETNMIKLTEEMMRRQLWEKKYSDAIAGQLYKLHTGQTVEGISRVARVSEIETGFGGGLAGTGKPGPASEEFLKRWPTESVALGNKPVESFATRVNELMRFVIQKGMDVKHAGVEAVGSTVIANIGKKSGAKVIMQAMADMKDQFDDLWEFNNQIANEVRLRVGKLSTPELQQELKRFEPDLNIESMGLDREAIIKKIIKHVDIEAVFEELFNQIRRQAIEGMAKKQRMEIESLPMGQTRMKRIHQIEASGGYERYATEKVDKAASEKGISLFTDITTSLQPLYRLRTSMESMSETAKRAVGRFEPEEIFLPEDQSTKLKRDLENVRKSANVLSTAMGTAVGGKTGIYNILVTSSIKQRYQDLAELEKLDKEAKQYTGKGPSFLVDAMEGNALAIKTWADAAKQIKPSTGAIGPVPAPEEMFKFIDDLVKVREVAKDKTSEIADMAGLPVMSQEEKAAIGAGVREKHGAEVFDKIKSILEKEALSKGEQVVPEELTNRAQDMADKLLDVIEFQAVMAEQMKRVSEIIKTVPMQRAYLEKAFPTYGKEPQIDVADMKEGVQDTSENYTKQIQDWYSKQFPGKDMVDQVRKTMDTLSSKPASEAIPEVLFGDPIEKAKEEVSEAFNRIISDEVIRRKREALKYLETKMAGKPTGQEAPLHEVFRASGVHGGGMYGGGTQQEAILRQMLGMETPSMLLEATAFKGSAIHRQRQSEFVKKYPGTEIEKPVEDVENQITGHLDVLYNKAGQKIVTDIKTVYSAKQFDRLKEIAKNIEENKTTLQQEIDKIKSQKKISDIDKNVVRRLEDYASQVNIYLKGVSDAVGEILIVSSGDPNQEVTIPIGKFDPTRFTKDIEEVKKAREKIQKLIAALAIGGGIPKDLFADLPDIYNTLSEKLKTVSAEDFTKGLPKRPIGEKAAPAQEVLGRLTTEESRMFDKLSKEYLEIFEALGGPGKAEDTYKRLYTPLAGGGGGRKPPTPPGGMGGPGSGGFDDDEEFKKRLQELLAKLRPGKEPEVPQVANLIEAIDEALERIAQARGAGNDKLADELQKFVNDIKNYIDSTGQSMDSLRELARLFTDLDKYKTGVGPGADDFSKFRKRDIDKITPDRPESIHKNLRALYEAAIRTHALAGDEELQKFGPEIADLLKEAAEKGSGADIAQRISDAIANLPEEKKGMMKRVWMYYKKAVSEYFLKRLDSLKQDIESGGIGTAEGRESYLEYEQIMEKFLGNIKGTQGRMSDIYTRVGPSGKKNEFVDPELARLVGIYKTPKQLEEFAKRSAGITPEVSPIMDLLVGDLDPNALDKMLSPIEKVRAAFRMMAKEDPAMKEILEDADLFKRIGDEAIKTWDFDKVTQSVTKLRAALQSYNRLQIGGFGGFGEEYPEEVRKNVEDTIKYLKQLEGMFATTGGQKASPMGLTGVPQFLDPTTQTLLHKRNIAQIRKYYETSESEGGAKVGEAFTYRYKVVDPATKQTLTSMAEDFRKIGEEASRSSGKIGLFTQKSEDLVQSWQERKGLGQAFGRVIRWGVASRTVYGLVGALQDMVSTISDVELGVANLRQVMSPLETDFEQLTQSAVDFAKEFGLPIRQVIDGMKVFAQQGLAQREVVDMTRTSMIAANVTTLNAADATEALTAAVKSYGTAGEGTMRFMDAWSQVEARHAITSKDLAQSLRKSAAVAKTTGITFDELNAITTGIGETTRQTGNEIGTSLRFIFRRLQSEKGPPALSKIGIPTIGEGGDIRRGFDILGDLAKRWDTLTNAQRLSVAQAIGGTRQYNSLLVLMDHWNDVLTALSNSINSKGAAEMRNAIVMDTYAKKVQEVRAAMAELQIQFGKFALPIAKTILGGLKGVLEAISSIPPGLKIAAVAFAGLFVAIAKGQDLLDGLLDKFSSFKGVFKDFGGQFMKQLKVGIFETFGKIPKGLGGLETRGLKTIGKSGFQLKDFESVIGKAMFLITDFGRSWNSMMSEMAYSGSATSETISNVFGKAAGGLASWGLRVGVKGNPLLGGAIEAMAAGAKTGSVAFEKLGKAFGIPAEALAKWSTENASFVASIGPLIGSMAALIPLSGKLGDYFKRLTYTASDYEKSMLSVRMLQDSEINRVGDIISQYDRLDAVVRKAAKARSPEAAQRAMRREEYKSPIFAMAQAVDVAQEMGNSLAKTNVELIRGFDEFGNAILQTTMNMKDYLSILKMTREEEKSLTELKVVSKYIEDLTGAGKATEKFKSELKKFVEEIPAIGTVIAKSIKVSPAQELKEARDDVNRVLAEGQRFPGSPAYETLYKKYSETLDKARTNFKGVYKDFKRVLSDIKTKGMGPQQIADLLGKPELEEGYKLIVDVEIEPKFNKLGLVRKPIDWKDVLGTEILKKMHPESTFNYTAELTKEMLRESQIPQRDKEAFVNDIVLFTDDIDKAFNIAGKQGVLKFREGLGYFVEGIDKEFRVVREMPFDTIKQFVDSIFPARKMVDDIDENLEILEEALTGAAAGMVGVTSKTFKKNFNLGARFFSQIPTTSLLQTDMGFNRFASPGQNRFGPQELKADFPEKVKKYYIEPYEQLSAIIEEPKKRLEAEHSIAKGLAEDIEHLTTVIKNNQVAMQYMALIEDLNKEFSESARTLEETVKAERMRNQYLVETAGLLKGVPEGLSDLNTGMRNIFELSAQQRLLERERVLPPDQRQFTNARLDVVELDTRRKALANEQAGIAKAIVQLGTIREQAEGAGVVVPPERLMSIKETMAAGGTPMEGLMLDQQKRTAENTGKMAESLDDLLVAMNNPKAITRTMRSINFTTADLSGQITELSKSGKVASYDLRNGLDKLAKMRELYAKSGRTELVSVLDESLNKLSEQMITQLGYRRSSAIVSGKYEPTIPDPIELMRRQMSINDYSMWQRLPGGYNSQEMISRSLGGLGGKELLTTLERAAERPPTAAELGLPGHMMSAVPFGVGPMDAARYRKPGYPQTSYQEVTGSGEFKRVKSLLQEQTKISVTDSKTLTKLFAAYAGFNDIYRRASDREQRAYDVQIEQLKGQRKDILASYRSKELPLDQYRKQMTDITAQINELTTKKKEAGETAQKRATQETIGVIGSAGTTFARSIGVSEKALKGFGATAAASIIAWNTWGALTGEELPDAIKRATDAASDWAQDAGDNIGILDKALFKFGKFTGFGLGKAGKAGATAKDVENFEKSQKKILNDEEKEKISRMKDFKANQDNAKTADDTLKSMKDGTDKQLSNDEQIMNINKDQLSTLLAIEENTRSSAESGEKPKKEPDSFTKELRSRLDTIKQDRLMGGDVGTTIRNFLTMAVATAAGGYAGKKTQLSAELGEARRQSEDLAQALDRLFAKFPNELQQMVVDFKKRREEATKGAGEPQGPMDEVSRLIDTQKEYQRWLSELVSWGERMGVEMGALNDKSEKAKDKMHLAEVGADIAKQIDKLGLAIKEAFVDLEVDLKYGLEVVGAMRGLPKFEELPVGKLASELTPTENLMKEGGAPWQSIYKIFQATAKARALAMDQLKKQAKDMVVTDISVRRELDVAMAPVARDRQDREKAIKDNTEFYTKMADQRTEYARAYRESLRNAQKGFEAGDITEEEYKDMKETATYGMTTHNQASRAYRQKAEEFSRRISEDYNNAIQFPDRLREQMEKVEAAKAGAKELRGRVMTGDLKGQSDAYKQLSMANKKQIEEQQKLADLQKFGETSPLVKFYDTMNTKAQEAVELSKKQVEAYDGTAKSVAILNTRMMELASGIMAVGLNISQLDVDFTKLKDTFNLNELQQQAQLLADEMEKSILGGKHPLSPVAPTYDMLKAGIPEENLFNLNKYESQMASLVGSRKLITAEEVARINFQKKADVNVYRQQQEDDKLRRQQRLALDMNQAILQAEQRTAKIEDPRMRGALIESFQSIRSGLLGQFKTAALPGEEREVEPGVMVRERAGFDLQTPIDQVKELLRNNPELQREMADVLGRMEGYQKQTLEDLPVFQGNDLVGMLSTSNAFLTGINTNTANTVAAIQDLSKLMPTNKTAEPASVPSTISSSEEPGGWVNPVKFWWDKLFGSMSGGGTIFGPGGPREDRVPIMASAGEYVIRSAAAKRLGKPILNYMNSTGQIPGMEDGGSPKEEFTKRQLAMGVSMEDIKKELGGLQRPAIDPIDLMSGAAGVKLAGVGFSKTTLPLLTYLMARAGLMAGKKGMNEGLYDGIPKAVGSTFAGGGDVDPDLAYSYDKFKNVIYGLQSIGRLPKDLTVDDDSFFKYLKDAKDPAKASELFNTFGNQITKMTDFATGQFNLHKINLKQFDPAKFGHFQDSGELSMNSLLFTDTKNMQESLTKSMADKFNVKGDVDSEGYPFTHELAHAYTMPGYGKKLEGSAADVMKYATELQSDKGKIGEVSRYALTNIHDTAAELISSAFHTGRRSSDVVDRVKDILGIAFHGGGQVKTLPSYASGTPYVPRTGLAWVHKGERITPSFANGGIVGFAEGGTVMKEVLNAGESIGEAIAKVLEKVELTAKLVDDTVKLDKDTIEVDPANLIDELSNVKLQVEDVSIANVQEISDSLRTVLESVDLGGARGVGADSEAKLDAFMVEMRDKLDRQDTRALEKADELDDKIMVLETDKESLSSELTSIKSDLRDVLNKVDDMYTVSENNIDTVNDKSSLEARLTEALSDFRSSELAPLKSQVSVLSSNISSLNNAIDNAQDLINTVNNRLSLRK